MVVKEEREESMDTDVLASPAAPTPLKETPMGEESTNQNPPHDSDPNEDELLGPITDISIPRGYSDDSITLIIPPGEDDL